MKILFFTLLMAATTVYAQEAEYRVLSEKKIDDNLVMQTAVLTIFNNTAQPLCLNLSTTFREKMLSEDTVMLASLGNDTACQYFKLWISDENKQSGYDKFRTYPLVLNSKASFTATISLLLNANCRDSWLEYAYTNQNAAASTDFNSMFNKNRKWNTNLKLKFQRRRIALRND